MAEGAFVAYYRVSTERQGRLGALAAHAHASHSSDRGALIHLVQQPLGHAAVTTTGRCLHARPTDSSARYLGV